MTSTRRRRKTSIPFPQAKTLVVARVITRDCAPDPGDGGSTTSITFIENGGDTTVATQNVGGFSASGSVGIVRPTVGRVISADDKLQAQPNAAYGSVETSKVDVFGYLY